MKNGGFRKVIFFIDRFVEYTGALMMFGMVAIVIWQVFGRYVLHKTPSWSEEVALLLMMYFGFLSISIGFRYQFHIRIHFIADRFPKPIQVLLNKLADLLVAAFGILLMIEGYKFTVLTWSSTLPVTKLPTGVQYLIIPVTGVLTFVYGLLWLFGWKEKETWH
jgi:TRAP-type transport system small permease protein